MSTDNIASDLSQVGYEQLANFRYHIRRFQHFSEENARAHGLEPKQHQLMLAIKGLPEGVRPTVTNLSLRMCLRHHSTVELIDRLEERGTVVRRSSPHDRREVLVALTPKGERVLRNLSVMHLQELRSMAPELLQDLQEILKLQEVDDLEVDA